MAADDHTSRQKAMALILATDGPHQLYSILAELREVIVDTVIALYDTDFFAQATRSRASTATLLRCVAVCRAQRLMWPT
ncbi:MAG: hypothetical protein E6J91_44320 [Deltaproteobacteria bacterium]|nr:MAG: hypothetical protein E6J91_44320 [Deltaproteobacteria bacterium]